MQTHIISLIADPTRAPLDPSLCESLRNAWGGGTVTWLAPDVAAEFAVPDRPGNFWEVWETCQGMAVDIVALPAGGERRKKLLLADMDSTLIRQECIDELAAEAGIGPQVAEITARAMNGELEFEAALEARVGLLKGLSENVIGKVLEERISYMPGGRTLVATMKSDGAYCVLVSGGFTAFSGRVAETLGFDMHRANTLLAENGRLTGRVARPILGRDAKVATLREQAARLGLDLSETLAVGDGANDLGMLGLAGVGVALHAKPAVQAECPVRINHGDLTALLYLQGYARDEFAA